MSNGCGKAYNGEHKVECAPLRCGCHLYFATAKDKRERTLEVLLCPECKAKEAQ